MPHSEQYERLVDRTSTPDACHLWTGRPSRNGYGRVKYGGKADYAHRYGYELIHGPIPEGMVIRHTCDVKLCQNPAHWLIGTQADNIRDRDERGRGFWPVGEAHPQSKLTAVQVQEIRDRYAAGEVTQQALASEFGVVQAVIHKIVRQKNWKQG